MEDLGSSGGDAKVKIKFGFIRGLKNSYFNIYLRTLLTIIFCFILYTVNAKLYFFVKLSALTNMLNRNSGVGKEYGPPL